MSQQIQLCSKDPSHGVAIGGFRRRDLCRADYIADVTATGELVEVEVVGDLPLTGLDGVSVRKGGRVKLDPEETNIVALVYAGLAKVVPAKAAKAAEKG